MAGTQKSSAKVIPLRGVVNAEEYEVGGIVGSNNNNQSKIIDCFSEANVSGSFRSWRIGRA